MQGRKQNVHIYLSVKLQVLTELIKSVVMVTADIECSRSWFQVPKIIKMAITKFLLMEGNIACRFKQSDGEIDENFFNDKRKYGTVVCVHTCTV